MSSLNSISNRIYNYRVNDTRLKLNQRQIKADIIDLRAKLMRQSVEKSNKIDAIFWQNLGKLECIKIDAAESASIAIGKSVIRTKNKLPRRVRLKNLESLRITLLDRMTSIPIIPEQRAEFIKYEKYTNKELWAFERFDYIYIVCDTKLTSRTIKWISGAGVLVNPAAAASLLTDDDLPCFTDDTDFPIPEDMEDDIINIIMDKELKRAGISKEEFSTYKEGKSIVQQQ